MNGLPDGALLGVIEAGEQVVGSLLTAGLRAFVAPDGTERQLPIWCAITDRRAWLLCGDEDDRWAIAEPRRSEVRVARGWTWDQLVVGDHRTPLRRGTRKAAESLVSRFTGDPDGERWPPPAPAGPEGRARAARGADDVPEWIARGVPGDPDERWLHGARTASQQPFNQPDGTVARAAIWVAHSDRRQVLAALGPDDQVWWQLFSGPLVRQPRPGSDRLTAGSRVLRGPPLADRAAEIAAEISTQPGPGARWEQIATAVLEDGHARRAVRLVAEALQAGHDEVWHLVSRLLFKVGARELAAGAAARALQTRPDLDVGAVVESWNRAGDLRRLRREDVDVSFIRGLMRSEIASLGEPQPPDGLPWPPERPDAVWAAALAMQDRFSDASALWGDRSETARQLSAVASLKTAEGAPDADVAWTDAAEALRAAGEPDAPAALERAIALDPTPGRLWTRASWAWDDGDGVTARRYWLAAITVDPSGEHGVPLAADTRRVLARHAEAEEEWGAAATAWRQSLDQDPDDAESWRRAATLLDTRLGRIADAAMVLAAYCEHHPSLDPAPEALWQIRRDLASLQLRADDQAAAADTLRALVEGDYLHPDALLAALTLGEGLPLPLGWWQHLWELMTGSDEHGAALEPRAALTLEEMEALHPGGIGFMERVRQSLHGAETPARSELVRGLERIGAHSHPRVWEAVQDLSKVLDLEPPDVFLFRGDGAWGCSAWATEPPLVLVGAEHLVQGPRHLDDQALRFLLAVELVHLRCEHPVLFFDTDLIGTSRSVYSAFGKYAGTAESIVDVVTLVPGIDQLTKLQTVIGLSRKVFATRSAIDKASGVAGPVLERLGIAASASTGGIGREGLEGAALAFRVQADRVALLLVGDARAATEAVLRSARSLDAVDRADAEGLAAVLADEPPAEALRLTALLEFAATLHQAGR